MTTALDQSNQCYETPFSLSSTAIEELEWWNTQLAHWNGKSLVLRQPDLQIESDASLRGWGASCQGTQTGGPWSQQEQQLHINCLELLAATLAIKTFLKGQGNKSVLLLLDNQAGKRTVDVVPTEGHTSDGTTYTRERECDSRQGVESDEGPLRLDAQSGDLPPDPKALSRPRDRSICNMTISSTTPLLQLETRSPSRSNRCLGTTEGLCQPPLEPRRESTSEGGVSGGGASYTNSSNMAVTAMVSQATEPINLEPTEDRSSTSGNNRGSSGISGRVAYLRQHYKDKKLSPEASDLLLSSWRQKTSQSYDSLSKKWISWCTERQCDPISGPIEDVVNFLAHLYREGYQYRSLNAYRSAIASMHSPTLLANIHWSTDY